MIYTHIRILFFHFPKFDFDNKRVFPPETLLAMHGRLTDFW